MKLLVSIILVCLYVAPVFAEDVTVTLTDDQVAAWRNMLNIADEDSLAEALNAHLVTGAESHINQRLEEEINKLTREELKALIPDFKVKKDK